MFFGLPPTVDIQLMWTVSLLACGLSAAMNSTLLSISVAMKARLRENAQRREDEHTGRAAARADEPRRIWPRWTAAVQRRRR